MCPRGLAGPDGQVTERGPPPCGGICSLGESPSHVASASGGLSWCVGWGGPVQVLHGPPRRWSGPKVEPRTPPCGPHPANQRAQSYVQVGAEPRPWQEPGGCNLPIPGSVVPKARCPAGAPLHRPVSTPPVCPSSNLIRYLKLVLSLAKAETLFC